MDRSKSLAGIDRDRVARHRNQMHDIALQKQISVIQREGKLIERELREITKVKNTLMQIRSPLKKRVLRSEGGSSYRETKTKRPTNKCKTSKKRHSSKTGKKEQRSINNAESSKSVDGCEVERPKLLKGIAERDGPNSCRKQLNPPLVNSHSSHEQSVAARICTSQPKQDTQNTQTRKISSFRKHAEKSSEREVENVEKRISTGENYTLPPVDVSKGTCNRGPKSEASIVHTTRSISATPPSRPVCVSVQDRPETSATVALRNSKLSEHPLAELSLPAATRSRHEQEEELTLTMEETLRIKGKFRQIGHSIIATALLKGIKQRGHLTSEAIHNMHKPVMVSDKTNQKQEESGSEDNDDVPDKTGLEKFRKVTRKAMHVNAFVNNGRQKSGNHLQQGIKKANDEGDVDSQDSNMKHENKPIQGRKRFAGVAHAILFAKTLQTRLDCTETDNERRNGTKKPLMNLYTRERRKKLSNSAMTTSPSGSATASELPKSKVVTFRLDHAWE